MREHVVSLVNSFPFIGAWIRWGCSRIGKTENHLPDWSRTIRDKEWNILVHEEKGTRVVLATGVGGYLAGATVESLLGVALTLRGAYVEVLLCDGLLSACQNCDYRKFPTASTFVRKGPSGMLCNTCYPPAAHLYETLGFKVHRLGDWVRAEDHDDLGDLIEKHSMKDLIGHKDQGMAVGEHALAGALRYFARATLEGEIGVKVFKAYFQSAFLAARAARRLMESRGYKKAVFNHGIYVPQGVFGEAARSLGIDVVNWNPAYRKKCFIFSHGDTYHHTLMSEPTENWENLSLPPAEMQRLEDYLKSRWHGTQDWIWFHERPQFDETSIFRAVKADRKKPWIGLLTNVMWDAQLHYPANAFSNMRDWIFETIDYFEARPDLQLIIRVHPAEIRGTLPSRQKMVDEIRRRGKPLPTNVFIVGPEDPVSTYSLMERCNTVLIYGTKTGVELTSQGIPVIVAGEAWIRNKGVTKDAQSPTHYRQLLDQLPVMGRLPEEQIKRARIYAYHFFFRRMIPLGFMEPQRGDPPFGLRPGICLSDLKEGSDPGLDVICRGILSGTPFIFPAENTPSSK
ncbi:MAG: capsule biosynthesis protein [Elusimicrobia bacterium]|nr:capsule biosynthesis protein [Elusimicrobiota bacterium]